MFGCLLGVKFNKKTPKHLLPSPKLLIFVNAPEQLLSTGKLLFYFALTTSDWKASLINLAREYNSSMSLQSSNTEIVILADSTA
jgi:hypothetical protein